MYTYAGLIHIPYAGFDFNPSNGKVVEVFVAPSQKVTLHPGDQILQIGSMSWEDFRRKSNPILFYGISMGQIVSIEVQRDEQVLKIPWVLPGFSFQEFLDRILNVWLVSYVFWLAGTATVLHIRPKDERWGLLTAFFFLGAIWLVTGNVSGWRIWGSAFLLRAAIWLWVPVCLHLHWIFPKPLGKISPLLLRGVYLAAFFIAGIEWFQILPRNAYFWGFLLAAVGSVVLLVLHCIFQQTDRQELRLLATTIGIIILPSVSISIVRLFGDYPRLGSGSLLALPILPLVYFYTIYRRQLGGLEIRANRLISAYLFFVLLGATISIPISLVYSYLNYSGGATLIGILAALLAGFLAVLGYPLLVRFIDQRLLGIPLPPTYLLGMFSSRITTILDIPGLTHLLRDEILSSLLVNQSALLRFEEPNHIVPLYIDGIDKKYIPTEINVSNLLDRAGVYHFPAIPINNMQQAFAWVHLLFPLNAGGKLIGFWLLGRRDPDDFYARSEIPVLQSIANQTAIAIINISQAQVLRALYQTNIERHEKERANLAHDLHDEVLNQLAALFMNYDVREIAPDFESRYRNVVTRIRHMISGLRPAMLNFGLQAALEELVDDLSERIGNNASISIDMPPGEIRYESEVEEHLYRIVQQACENALSHAHAKSIRITGELETDQITLVIEDNGSGFSIQEQLNFDKLLAEKHYGLVGMYERADLIGANLRIESIPEHGTRLFITKGHVQRKSNGLSNII